MDCNDVREMLPFLGDGSLEPEVERAVRGHLMKCTACEREYDELRKFLNMTDEVFLENTPETLPGYLGLVRNRIRKKRVARKIAWRFVPVAAAVFMIATATLLVSNGFFMDSEMIVQDGEQAERIVEANQSYGDYYDLDAYDLDNLVNVDQSTEETIIVNTLFTHAYDDVTPEDIIKMMNEEQVNIMLTSSQR